MHVQQLGVIGGGIDCVGDGDRAGSPRARFLHMKRIALPDSFCKNYGVQSDLFDIYGLSPKHIAKSVIEKVGRLDRGSYGITSV